MACEDVKFKTGNICRIYIKNFLTFREVEVRPKPKLNFICGPNGSGKSTVLCAICLCLGGKPTVMGRSKEIYDYVKMGEAEATLEVEVYVEGEINAVIMNKINKQTRTCKWFLQGKEVTHKMVMRRIEGLSIQVDNLCQFLPQDRVASFAKMNCPELLVATEKAVGDPSLYEQHKTLCDSGQALTSLQHKKKELQSEVSQAERRNARLKDVVENLEVKQKLEAELDELRTQRAWYLYDYKRKIHLQHKEELAKKEEEMNALKSEMEPTVAKIKENNATLHQMKKKIKEKTEFVRKSQQTDSRLKLECDNLGDKLKDAKRSFVAKQQMEQQRQNELLDYRRQLDVLLGQLQNLPDLNEEEATRRLKELTDRIHKSSQHIVRLQGQMSEVLVSKEHKASNIKAHMKELNTLQDVIGQRMELLRSHNNDAYRATQWLQNNRQSFRGMVYPPICALLNIKNQQYARYIENRVMERDLVAFVCENKDDVNQLKEEMDRQRIRVNIVYANPALLDKYKPAHSIRELRRFGFETYMLDCVEAPDAILSFLCQNYSIHSVPIGASGDYDAVPPSISVFYLGNSRYSRSSSRYDGQVSTSIFPIGSSRLLQIVQDGKRIAALKAKVEQLEQEIKEDEESVRGIKQQEEELSKSLESWRNEKRSLSSRKEERKMLDQRISHKKAQIKKHEEEGWDLKSARATFDEAVKRCIKDHINTSLQMQANMLNTGLGVCECLQLEGKAKVLAAEVVSLEQDTSEWKGRVAELEQELESMSRELEKQKLEGRDALNELKRLLGIVSIKEITPEIRERFLNSSLEETERLLAEKDAHLACLVTASSTELKEYKDGQKELDRLLGDLQEVYRTLETHHQDLDGVKNSWLPHITQLVGDISARFSQFMARMGYAGEVSLNKNGEDFTGYGLAIKVKFRGEQKLQQLTAQQQSGGERAVSTALYLLALQSLTSAPFRSVDEINQGMDKVNERKMLEMLMETEGCEGSSQYFFVTPKLLQNIEYSNKVNVMVVLNSPTTLSHRRLTVKRILKRKEEANRRGANRSGQGL